MIPTAILLLEHNGLYDVSGTTVVVCDVRRRAVDDTTR